jgi:hypothetical protein
LPAIVSASAGVAERYPERLAPLLLNDPGSAAELISRLDFWRRDSQLQSHVHEFAARLRSRTWDHMARDIVAAAGALT